MTVTSDWRRQIESASRRSFAGCGTVPCYGVPFDASEPLDESALVNASTVARTLGVRRPRHLPVVNAFDGREYRIGESFPDPNIEPMRDVPIRLLDIDDRFFTVRALVQRPDEQLMWVPLIVRFSHPRYFLRRVAFIPT